ncbi:MAG: haloalkane dehalogenase [Candidatus Binatia bacterium]|nr:MAG: haloalkane dehalogenase [Candidatus Binatia bacterium]
MKKLRTPEERFQDLPGYPFRPNYLEVPDGEGGTLRIHYVDEGPKEAEVILCLHGEPSWSYLYRKMIPIFVDAGYRVLAPDLVGFGRSDKPAERSDYTYQRHVDWMGAWFDALRLDRVTLFCQDWGGLVGLRVLADRPDRFDRVVAANTGLPTGDVPLSDAFLAWRKFSQEVPEFPVGTLIAGACRTELPPEVVRAYDAPFPDESYKAGARQFPVLVPISPDDPAAPANRRAWEVLRRWEKPFLTAFSDSDPVTRGGERIFQELVPGARGQPHTIVEGAGHFLQEDKGEELAELVVRFCRENPRL